MTEDGTRDEPPTPEAEAAVSRLLGEAGGPLAMPADVAARLDSVLGELEAERAGKTPGGGRVVEVHARRRWPRALLAAAAVVIGGYGVGTVLGEGTLSGMDSASSGDATTSDSTLADPESAAGASGDDTGGGQDEDSPEAGAPQAGEDLSSAMRLRSPLLLRSDDLESGARRALRLLEASPTALSSQRAESFAERSGCTPPPLAEGEQAVPVRYDGVRALLVLGPERADTVEATVYSCAGADLAGTRVRR